MYLIDTNVLSEIVRPRPDLRVVRKLLTSDPALRFASEITRYELRYGAMLLADNGALWRRIEEHIVPVVQWLPVDMAVATAAADLAALLRRTGRPVDWTDSMLAATATANHFTMVTRNVRHFERVPDLQVENWFEE